MMYITRHYSVSVPSPFLPKPNHAEAPALNVPTGNNTANNAHITYHILFPHVKS